MARHLLPLRAALLLALACGCAATPARSERLVVFETPDFGCGGVAGLG